MPVIVSVGLSRKVSKDYNSTGFTLNIQSELPATAVQDPNELAAATEHLFQLADDLLDEQVRKHQGDENASNTPKPIADRVNNSHRPPERQPSNGNTRPAMRSVGAGNGVGRPGGGNHSRNKSATPNSSGRGVTEAQVNAIERMCKRAKVDPDTYAGDEWGVPYKELTIKQASDMIDALKGMIETGSGQETR